MGSLQKRKRSCDDDNDVDRIKVKKIVLECQSKTLIFSHKFPEWTYP